MQKITPFLWFNRPSRTGNELLRFHFQELKSPQRLPLRRSRPRPQRFSHVRNLRTQRTKFHRPQRRPALQLLRSHLLPHRLQNPKEVDDLWEKLSAGGSKSRCGWLKDKFGLSWQVIPTALGKMLQDKDPAKSKRVMQAMLQMDKIDIAKLKQAYNQK